MFSQHPVLSEPNQNKKQKHVRVLDPARHKTICCNVV